MQRRRRSFVMFICLLAPLFLSSVTWAERHKPAEVILETTGIKGSLVLHVGCGEDGHLADGRQPDLLKN
ncbi:MAG: hypothetical protein JSU70_01400 [Phycisphaerales bacterium]|nr:MAG: hypothetical protein JSU70_01400 [Phycisphaerales bacterium]